MTSGEHMEAIDVIRLTQNGQILYTEGKISQSVREFEEAHAHALKLGNQSITETCAYNLACALAANGNGENAMQYLNTLSQHYVDSLDEGELTFLKALAEQHKSDGSEKCRGLYEKALKQLNRLHSNMHASLKKYILLQLCNFEQDIPKLIKYKTQLASIYRDLNMPYKQLEMLCDRAVLHFKQGELQDASNMADKCHSIIQKIQREDTDKYVHALNEVGLIYSQVKKYDRAREYFEKGLKIIGKQDNKSKAVLLQNMGAVYNFKLEQEENMDYADRALHYHNQAIEEYLKQGEMQCQAYCYLNKGFVEGKKKKMVSAKEAYHHALIKIEERGSQKDYFSVKWQGFEGLSAVACSQGDVRKTQEYLHRAYRLVLQDEEDPVQKIASLRIYNKLVSCGLPVARQPVSGLEGE